MDLLSVIPFSVAYIMLVLIEKRRKRDLGSGYALNRLQLIAYDNQLSEVQQFLETEIIIAPTNGFLDRYHNMLAKRALEWVVEQRMANERMLSNTDILAFGVLPNQ